MECEDFETAKKIIQELLVVCRSKIESKTVKKSVDFILNHCKGNKTENSAYEEVEDENLFDETLLDEEVDDADFEWLDELSSIKMKGEKKAEIGDSNWLFLPTLQKHIISLAKRLPLWTAVMKNAFNSTVVLQNQANAESAFNVIKNVIFANVRLPIRCDQFVKMHINSIDGLAKHMLTKQIGESNAKASQKDPVEKDPEENWKNKTKKAKRKEQQQLLQRRVQHIEMMSNSYLNRRRRHAPFFLNMCTFDSILHALCCGYMDSLNLKKHFDELSIDKERKTNIYCVRLNSFQPEM